MIISCIQPTDGENNMGDIYGIVRKDKNIICYIGQTIRGYKWRWQQHKQKAKNAQPSHYALYAAIQKYGIDNFYPILIEQCDNSLLNEKEQYYIKKYHTKWDEGGYNLTDGGDTGSVTNKVITYRYTLAGNYIDSFESIKEASEKLNISYSGIIKVMNGQLNQAGNFRWSKEKLDKLPEINIRVKEVHQYSLNNEYIQSFPSIRQAAIALGNVNLANNISLVLRGKRQTASGYKWKY